MRQHVVREVLGRVEGMRMETIACLARQPQDVLIESRDVDGNVGPVVMRRSEERRHQGEVVILALELELGAALVPAFENRAQGIYILAQARYRRFPLGAVAPLDVAFDLGAEPEDEAPA